MGYDTPSQWNNGDNNFNWESKIDNYYFIIKVSSEHYIDSLWCLNSLFNGDYLWLNYHLAHAVEIF